MIYTALVLSLCLILFTIRQFAKAGPAIRGWWKFIIFPTMFLLSVAVYSTVIVSKTAIQLLFLLNAVFLFFNLHSIYYSFFGPIIESKLTTREISSYGNFLIYFFIGASLYGWLSFLNSPLWPLILVVLSVSLIVIYEILWENKISGREALVFIIIGSLILLEIAWSMSFFPLNFNIIGLILAICYYMIAGFIKYYLLDNLNKKIIRSYLFVGFGSIFILLLTARWF